MSQYPPNDPNQPPYPGQQPSPGQPYPPAGQQPNPGQPYPGQPYPPAGQQPSPGQPGYGAPGYPGGGYPAPGYPAPGYPAPGYPAAAPPKKSRRTLFVVLGIVLVVCCLGGVGAGIFGYHALKSVTAPVHDAAAKYLDALKAQDYDTAYGLLCTDVTSVLSKDDFPDVAPKVDSYKITGTTISNVNGTKTGTVTATITADGTTGAHQLTLLKEGGDWHICDSA